MSRELLSEAAECLETWADEDDRARELSLRLRLVAEGIEEGWPVSTISDTVEWTDPTTGASVVAHRRGDIWEVARFPSGDGDPQAGITAESLGEAVEYAEEWLR